MDNLNSESSRNFAAQFFPNADLYKAFFDNSKEIFLAIDGVTVLDCNQLARVFWKVNSKNELIGKTLIELSAETNGEKKLTELFGSAGKGKKEKYNWLVRKFDGTAENATISVYQLPSESREYRLISIGRISETENTLRKEIEVSEGKYKRIFDSVQDLYYRTNMEGIILEVSPSIEKYAGLIDEDIVGKSIEDYYYRLEDRQLILAKLQKTGEIFDYELLLKAKDGSKIWTSVSAHLLYDENKQITGLEGWIRDISERKQNEEKIKQSLSLVQATLDSTADGILVVDRSGKIVSFNKTFKTIFELSDTVLETRDDNSALSEALKMLRDPDQFLSKVRYLYDHPEEESYDTLDFKDGRIIERYSSAQWIDGQPVGRVWSFRDDTKRKNAEQQLYLMAHTLKSVNECISITDTSDTILFVNDAFSRTYGYSPEELLGKNISLVRSELNDPDTISQIIESTNHEGWKGKLFNCRKDGSTFPISLSTTVVKNDHGEILGMVGVASDISEQKSEEQELKENEERYRLLIENQSEGIAIVDLNENFVFVNAATESIFAIKNGKLIGRNIKEFVLPELLEKIIDGTKERMNYEKSTFEFDIVTPKGIIKNLLISRSPQTDDTGKLAGAFVVIRDITAQKQAEEQLRKSEEKYRNLIESMPDGVYRSTHEGKFVEVNPAMVELLGYNNVDELLAIDIKKQLYFDLEDRESLALQLNDKELDVYPLKKKDGSVVYVEDHGWYVKDSNGDIIFHEGILRDVTQRKISEMQLQKYSKELKELNATKDKFFSIIAHDLKSPFSSINGLSDILKNEARHLDISTIEQYAGIINYTSNNTYQLLENLLEWALVQQSHIEFRPGSIIVNQVVNDILELSAEKANSKKISFSNLIPKKLIVRADENMIKTVFRNLISNALKFTPTNGTIQISANLSETHVEFSVKDSGMGISKENMEKIFNIGSTYTQRGTENEKGTGLGLLLCKEFVERNEGRIWVESELGQGSEFKFTLPLKL